LRQRAVRAGLLIQLSLASVGAVAGSAAGNPVSGPHETIDNRLTTTQPNAPSGFAFDGTYHAAGNPRGNPPYMRRMIFYNRSGTRYDTSVPARCSASDVELEMRGAAACPAGSRIGGGMSTALFMGRFSSTVQVDFFNNTNQQIILARSPFVSTVARGRIFPDGSTEFASPTCFPYVPPAGCPVDTLLQMKSSITVPPFTKTSNGVTRSYLTTPRTCPATGRWNSPVRLWWADGTVDTVVIPQPCTRPRESRKCVARRGSRKRRNCKAAPARRRY